MHAAYGRSSSVGKPLERRFRVKAQGHQKDKFAVLVFAD